MTSDDKVINGTAKQERFPDGTEGMPQLSSSCSTLALSGGRSAASSLTCSLPLHSLCRNTHLPQIISVSHTAQWY